jgi:hypothetical protein
MNEPINLSFLRNLMESDMPLPYVAPISMPHVSKVNPAQWAHERLCKYIQAFEAKLDETQEIGARLVSFGPALVFHIEDMGYHGPDIITFIGINENGERIQLIQSVTQLNVVLVAVKKRHDKPCRIGFSLAEATEKPSK